MSEYYKSLTEIPNTGGEVFVYQVANSKKGNWTVRIKRLNSPGYFTKALKTNDIGEAFRRANLHYLQVRQAEERKVILEPAANFRVLARKYLRELEKDNPKSYRTVGYQFENYYIPHFGNLNVQSLSQTAYIRYLNDFRLHNSKRKRPTVPTLNVEQQNLRSFLNWCYRTMKISAPIYMGRITKNINWIEAGNMKLVDMDKLQRRDLASYEAYAIWRDWTYYGRMTRWGRGEVEEIKNVMLSRMRMNFYIKSLFNLCCRPGEELLLARWQDMQIVESEEREGGLYVRFTTTHGKKVNRKSYPPVRSLAYVSDYRYAGMLLDWIELLTETGQGRDTPPDKPNRMCIHSEAQAASC